MGFWTWLLGNTKQNRELDKFDEERFKKLKEKREKKNDMPQM